MSPGQHRDRDSQETREQRDLSAEGRSQRDAHEIAELAAHRALKQAFALLGCDIDDQESINWFRADLVFAHDLRKASQQGKAIVFRVVLTALAGGLLTSLGIGIKAKYWP